MAHPLAVEGAIQLDERSLRRAVSDDFTPSTSTVRLTRIQSSTLPALPYRPGMSWWPGTSISSASGKRARTSLPLVCSSAAGCT